MNLPRAQVNRFRVLVFLIAIFAVVPAVAQTVKPQPEPPDVFGQRPPDPEELKRIREQQKALNKERFSSLKTDTDQLLALATELKQNVDKSSENTLSLEVIRKAEQIEKLAKQVREKMKGT